MDDVKVVVGRSNTTAVVGWLWLGLSAVFNLISRERERNGRSRESVERALEPSFHGREKTNGNKLCLFVFTGTTTTIMVGLVLESALALVDNIGARGPNDLIVFAYPVS